MYVAFHLALWFCQYTSVADLVGFLSAGSGCRENVLQGVIGEYLDSGCKYRSRDRHAMQAATIVTETGFLDKSLFVRERKATRPQNTLVMFLF